LVSSVNRTDLQLVRQRVKELIAGWTWWESLSAGPWRRTRSRRGVGLEAVGVRGIGWLVGAVVLGRAGIAGGTELPAIGGPAVREELDRVPVVMGVLLLLWVWVSRKT